MEIAIAAIGNSRGFRIPKALLDQCGFGATAEITVADGRLIVCPVSDVRKGWDDAFRRMAKRGDDELSGTPPPSFDETEWTW